MSHEDPTTHHVRSAIQGERESIRWVAGRFGPILLLQAEERLRRSGGVGFGPEDLVNETWVRLLPRLSDLRERGGRMTPVFCAFAGQTLIRTFYDLQRRAHRQERSASSSDLGGSAAEISSVGEGLFQRERLSASLQALNELEETDRLILVLRIMEDVPNKEVAARLGINEDTCSHRLRAAKVRLRRRLPGSMFEDL